MFELYLFATETIAGDESNYKSHVYIMYTCYHHLTLLPYLYRLKNVRIKRTKEGEGKRELQSVIQLSTIFTHHHATV